MKAKKKTTKRPKRDPDTLVIASKKSMVILPGTANILEVPGSGYITVTNQGTQPVYIAVGRDRRR